MCMYGHAQARTNNLPYTHTHIQICLFVYLSACLPACLSVRVRVRVWVYGLCMHACMECIAGVKFQFYRSRLWNPRRLSAAGPKANQSVPSHYPKP